MLNKKSVEDINVKGQRVLVRCDFNVPLQDGKITDENYDKEDLSVRRMMMALAQAGEYVIWRMLVSNFQDMENAKEDSETDGGNVEIDNE